MFKITNLILITLVLILFPVYLISATPAFTGAEGFGSETAHARGKNVCIVTNLNDVDKSQKVNLTPRGSFRHCLAKLEKLGGGYLIFDISGTIILKRPAFVPSHTYIAGQTSRGGIALEGAAVILKNVSDIVIRHLRHREALRKGDAFTVDNASNIIIDHISVSFFKDGAVDIVNNAHDITVQWSHMGDAMDSGSKKERYHGQPNLLRDNVNRISLHHNFYTHGHTRMPLVTHTVRHPGFLIEFSNNVIYNYGIFPSRFAAHDGQGNVIGNYYIPGRNTHGDNSGPAHKTKGRNAVVHAELEIGARPPILVENGMRLYLKDNLMEDGLGHDAEIFTDKYGKQIELGVPTRVTSVRDDDSLAEARMVASRRGKVIDAVLPFEPLPERIAEIPTVSLSSAANNKTVVLRDFGALPRDNTDNRLVKELKTRAGRWKYYKPNDNNYYEHTKQNDQDHDGLPDEFESRYGGNIEPIGRDLNPSLDNIEVYLDELAQNLLESNKNTPP